MRNRIRVCHEVIKVDRVMEVIRVIIIIHNPVLMGEGESAIVRIIVVISIDRVFRSMLQIKDMVFIFRIQRSMCAYTNL